MGLAAFAVAETLPPPQPRAPAARANDDSAFDEQVHAALRESSAEDPLDATCNESLVETGESETDAAAPTAPAEHQQNAVVASPIVLQILAHQEPGDEALAASALASSAESKADAVAAAESHAGPLSADKLGAAAAAAKQATAPPTTPQSASANAEAVVAQTNNAPAIQAKVDQAAGANAAEIAPATLAAVSPVRPEPSNAQLKSAKSAAVASEKSDAKATTFVADPRSDAAPATAGAHAQAVRAAKAERAAASLPPIDPQTPAAAPATSALTSSLSPSLSQHVSAQQAVVEHSAAHAAPATTQVAREIIRRFDGGNARFEVRLDPPELGRVEVRLEVSRDHRVTAVVAADSPQALAELMRHARDLEQTLQSVGLELSENGLSFDLRQGAQDSEDARGARDNGVAVLAESPPEAAPPTARPLGYERWRGVRIDMMV